MEIGHEEVCEGLLKIGTKKVNDLLKREMLAIIPQFEESEAGVTTFSRHRGHGFYMNQSYHCLDSSRKRTTLLSAKELSRSLALKMLPSKVIFFIFYFLLLSFVFNSKLLKKKKNYFLSKI